MSFRCPQSPTNVNYQMSPTPSLMREEISLGAPPPPPRISPLCILSQNCVLGYLPLSTSLAKMIGITMIDLDQLLLLCGYGLSFLEELWLLASVHNPPQRSQEKCGDGKSVDASQVPSLPSVSKYEGRIYKQPHLYV